MEQYTCRSQLLCGGAVFTRYCRRDAFAHQPENDKLNGALDGGAGLCWYEDSKLQTPLFVGQFDGSAEQAQLPGNCLRKILCARKQSARRCFAGKPDSAGRSANLASRSEFPIRPVSESAGGATRSINVGLFFRVSLAMQNKTMLFSLDDTLVNNALQTLNKTRPAMVDVIPTDGIVPLYINPQGVAKLLRNETLTSLPKNLEPVL